MKLGLFSKKLVIAGLISVSAVGVSSAMRNEGPQPGYLHRMYEWWKRLGNRDFMLYAFPVAQGDDGKFYVLVNENGTPFSMPIQHRPHRSFIPSPQIGITTLADAVPGLNVYWAKGRLMVGWGDVHQYYKERNQAYMAETLVEQVTDGCFKKGAGIQIDDHWFWGRQLNYTKRACYMNRDSETNQDKNIVVFLKATYKPLDDCKYHPGRVVKLAWLPIIDKGGPVTGGAWIDLNALNKLQQSARSRDVQWFNLLEQYWNNRPLTTGGYRAGAEEKLFGKKSERKTVYRRVIKFRNLEEEKEKQD